MTAAERERIAALEASLKAHAEASTEFRERISGDLSDIKDTLVVIRKWQDRRDGVEALGKFVFPGLALAIALFSLVMTLTGGL